MTNNIQISNLLQIWSYHHHPPTNTLSSTPRQRRHFSTCYKVFKFDHPSNLKKGAVSAVSKYANTQLQNKQPHYETNLSNFPLPLSPPILAGTLVIWPSNKNSTPLHYQRHPTCPTNHDFLKSQNPNSNHNLLASQSDNTSFPDTWFSVSNKSQGNFPNPIPYKL